MLLHKRILAFALLIWAISCSQGNKEKITNEVGGYSVTLSKDWVLYKLRDASTSIVSKRTPTIEATFYITVINSEYSSLEESFSSYVAQLPPGFENYVNLGNGKTQIDNKPAMWHKMSDTSKGVQIVTTIYLIQPPGSKLFVISCSAPKNALNKYEEDFTEMSFSLHLLNN